MITDAWVLDTEFIPNESCPVMDSVYKSDNK